ncbi:MAG: SLBB domain-containing protein, partial [Thermoguttaceae bacterium]|nr:SLBB domain-containing protein [Thermoguttaceae bacterium]
MSDKSTVARLGRSVHRGLAWVAGTAAIVLGLAGCSSPNLTPVSPDDEKPYRSVSLREGDAVKIVFPGAPSLNTVQQVRRDGMITLDEGNELMAAGKAPAQLQDEILALYSARLVRKEVLVTVDSSAYPVFVSGAVLRPGKILVTEPLTVVEAIMEAGGLDENRAQSKKVMVTREQDGVVSHYR